ncbi:MAG: copper amine oxidase N-terminal domain-containing protein, partial [Caldiserica bacterium]|nr:copper amine oxidase N-terminal domain-containing protein [Caldisericota bacterium]
VSWDQFEKMVTIVKGDVTIFLWIGKNYAIVSGNMVNLSAPPELKNGKTFVPIRFISESLNAKVEWEPLTQTITVKMVLTN